MKNKLLLRVPKTASSSMLELDIFTRTIFPDVVNDYFEFRQCRKNPEKYRLDRQKDKIMYFRTRRRLNVMEYVDDVFNLKRDNIFTFGFVRNPYDRAVSSWKFNNRNSMSEDTTFLQFCRKLKLVDLLPESGIAKDDQLLHACEQHPFLICREKKLEATFIGKFENLQQDFNTVCEKMGVKQQQLPHVNRTKHKHYTEYYDEETKQIVTEKYAKDIELFGYEFGD